MLPINLNGNSTLDTTIGRIFSAIVYALKMSANTEQHFTIPAGAKKVFIRSSYSNHGANNTLSNYYVIIDGASTLATIPSGNILDGTAPEVNPTEYVIKPTDSRISVITDDSPILTFAFYI